MALILSIDTALETATVCLGSSETIIAEQINENQMSHAGFVQPAIEKIFQATSYALADIDAVAVNYGPGSYTGLRVGLSSAKGLCFALNKPLILLNSLKLLCAQAIAEIDKPLAKYCAMIDARRMEVFAATYDNKLNELIATNTYILTDSDFTDKISGTENEIVFIGSGVKKWREIASNGNFTYVEHLKLASLVINKLAQESYAGKNFANLAYSEPNYFKQFYTTAILNRSKNDVK